MTRERGKGDGMHIERQRRRHHEGHILSSSASSHQQERCRKGLANDSQPPRPILVPPVSHTSVVLTRFVAICPQHSPVLGQYSVHTALKLALLSRRFVFHAGAPDHRAEVGPGRLVATLPLLWVLHTSQVPLRSMAGGSTRNDVDNHSCGLATTAPEGPDEGFRKTQPPRKVASNFVVNARR